MCVIIKREPGIVIPEQKIISAAHVNPDGWGISVIDRGKTDTRTVFSNKGNKPEDIIKALEDAKDQLVFLHLRYTTQGEKSTINCHPFTVHKEGDYRIEFMHNGTLTGFHDSTGKLSDSNLFATTILSPLLRAFKEIDGENVLDNPVVKNILEKYKGHSAFAIYDSNGKDLLIESTSCKKFDGWWASNEYSFNRYHRDPEPTSRSNFYGAWEDDRWNGNHGGSYSNWRDKQKETPSGNALSAPANGGATATSKANLTVVPNVKSTSTTTPSTSPGTDPNLGHATNKLKKHLAAKKPQDLTPPAKRVSFCDFAGIDDIRAVNFLDEEEIHDLCVELPIVATSLIMDLIYELYDRNRKQAINDAATSAAASNVQVG